MKLGVHIHLNLFCMRNETTPQNPKYFSSFGRLKACSLFCPKPAIFSHFFYICSCSTSTTLGTSILLTILRDLLFTAVENFAYFLRLGLFKPSVMRLLLTPHHAPAMLLGHPYTRLPVYTARHKYLWTNAIHIYCTSFSVHTYGFEKTLRKKSQTIKILYIDKLTQGYCYI